MTSSDHSDPQMLQKLAQQFLAGELSAELFQKAVAPSTTMEIAGATLDLDRKRRCGFPEVIFGEGKTAAVITEIFEALLLSEPEVLATRVSADKARHICDYFPSHTWKVHYHPTGRTLRIGKADAPAKAKVGKVCVLTAGSSDLPVAEEARETLEWMGVQVVFFNDIGVAGPQRLMAKLPQILGSDAVVVTAGMEAALASVVGGHVDCPVIAVPTSVGYGASLGGMAALLGMLNSCASNVAVVNIDAGFKGGYLAGLIARGNHKEGRK